MWKEPQPLKSAGPLNSAHEFVSTVEPSIALNHLMPVSVVILQTHGTANTVRTKSTTVKEGRSD